MWNPVPLDLALEWSMVGSITSALGCFVGCHKVGKIKTLLLFDSWDRPRYGLKRGSLQSGRGHAKAPSPPCFIWDRVGHPKLPALGKWLKISLGLGEILGDNMAQGCNTEDNFISISSASQAKSVTTNKPSPGQQQQWRGSKSTGQWAVENSAHSQSSACWADPRVNASNSSAAPTPKPQPSQLPERETEA